MSDLADTLRGPEKCIDDMLTHYTDVQDTLYSGGIGSGEMGCGWLESPDVWRMSGYPVLESLLKAMRLGAEDFTSPALYGAVNVFYFRCRRVRYPVMREGRGKRKHQAMVNGVPQYRVEIVRGGDREKVREALGWLAGAWPVRARYQPEMVEAITQRLERAKVA